MKKGDSCDCGKSFYCQKENDKFQKKNYYIVNISVLVKIFFKSKLKCVCLFCKLRRLTELLQIEIPWRFRTEVFFFSTYALRKHSKHIVDILRNCTKNIREKRCSKEYLESTKTYERKNVLQNNIRCCVNCNNFSHVKFLLQVQRQYTHRYEHTHIIFL